MVTRLRAFRPLRIFNRARVHTHKSPYNKPKQIWETSPAERAVTLRDKRIKYFLQLTTLQEQDEYLCVCVDLGTLTKTWPHATTVFRNYFSLTALRSL